MNPGAIAEAVERPPSPESPIAAVTAGTGERRRPSGNIGSLNDYGRGYFGSKGASGVWQTIINQIPPHDLFIEAFAGSATITRRMRRAAANIVIDSDAAACESCTAIFAETAGGSAMLAGNGDNAGVTVICADAVPWLETHRGEFNERTMVYCDPPYLFDVRSSRRRKRYKRELGETWSHAPLLGVLSRLSTQGVKVLLSGYRSALYEQWLGHWRRIDYRTMTRGGRRIESLWCNFDEPAELHDYRFAGANFRERERVKRKQKRWTAKLDTMAPKERAALLAAIDEWRRRRLYAK